MQEMDLSVEEVFANQLVRMVKGLPFEDVFQESSGSSQPGSVMHQENSQRALKVANNVEYPSKADLLHSQGRVPHTLFGRRPYIRAGIGGRMTRYRS